MLHPGFIWRHCVVVTFLILATAPTLLAQISSISDSESQTGLGGNNQIIGTVFAPSGRPLESRVPIRLSTMTRGDRVFTTNEHGAFAFRGLPSGSYIVTIEKALEYKPYTASVDIRQQRGAPAQISTLNIRLEFKDRDAALKPAVISAEFANVPKKALAHYDSAIELSKKNDYRGAIKELKLAIEEFPTFAQAFNELGVQYLKLNQLADADESFQEALKIDAELFTALINRGIVYVMMKRYGEAVPILRKGLKKNDRSPVGHYFLGQALANLGLFDEAEKELQSALQFGKAEMKEAHRVLAIIYMSRKENDRAVAELEAYLKVAPDASDAENLRSMIQKLRTP